MCEPVDPQRPLTEAEKTRMWHIIYKSLEPGMRPPVDVIEIDFCGDVNAFLQSMRGILDRYPASARGAKN